MTAVERVRRPMCAAAQEELSRSLRIKGSNDKVVKVGLKGGSTLAILSIKRSSTQKSTFPWVLPRLEQ
ncbi:hypothetical protein ANCDUO_09873 [Ancylostoma duodenale]|uniref:Uncharacterized protein n=1 Tax=Ancylostoma duodenale TaxID=51022 RepID=A0A0C2CSS5_9BILA|nr:hypothetical protein ANCDUO_09873 [Ancylostoma duodenale]